MAVTFLETRVIEAGQMLGHTLSVCILQNLEKCRVLWTNLSASWRNKLVFSFKNLSRTGKTDNLSSPDVHIGSFLIKYLDFLTELCAFNEFVYEGNVLIYR